MDKLIKAARIVARVAIGAVIVLVLVPTAVNVQTGGTMPEPFADYTDWLWPAVGVLVLVFVVLEAWEPVRRLFDAQVHSGRRHDAKNLANALHQVQRYVQQRLGGSLAEQVRIQLALDERPQAVMPPANLVQRVSGQDLSVPPYTRFVEVFDYLQDSILILGAPGAGKTTLLLELATSLAARAEAAADAGRHDDCVVPVLLDLVDWSNSGRRRLPIIPGRQPGRPRDFTSWLLNSMRRRYRMPVPVARRWLAEGRLALLLDGLDEVHPDNRQWCVQEINQLQERHDIPQVAVCSRETEYERLAKRLHLQAAVVIRPLTHDQVVEFFAASSPRLAGVSAALEDDPELWELLTSPLMLNIMALAYGDREVPELVTTGDVGERRRQLFDAYVVEVLARRNTPGARFSLEDSIAALHLLAATSARLDAGITVRRPNWENFGGFISETSVWLASMRLLPAGLIGAGGASLFVIARDVGVATALVVAAFLIPLNLVMLDSSPAGRRPAANVLRLRGRVFASTVVVFLLGVALGAVTMGFARWLASAVSWRHPWTVLLFVAALATGTWLLSMMLDHRTGVRLLLAGLTVVLTLAVGWWMGLPEALLAYGMDLAVIAITVVTTALFDLGKDVVGLPPDRRAQRNRTRSGLISLLAIPAAAVGGARIGGPVLAPLLGMPLVLGLGFGGGALLGVAVNWWGPVRVIFAWIGELTPWRRSFLRFAVDHSILTRAQGEYRFIHILVRDHLAACDPGRIAESVRARSAQLASADGGT